MSTARFLLIRPDRVGDVVLMTPLIRALRAGFPDAYIAALVRPYTRAVLEGNPRLDRILVDDAGGEHRGLTGFLSLARTVRSERFSVSLMLLPTGRHALLTLLSGIPSRISVGRKPYEVLTGCRPAGRNRDRPVRHEADYCVDLGRAVGVECPDLTPEIFLSEGEKRAGMRRLSALRGDARFLVGIHPGNGGSAPNWTASDYARLARTLVCEMGARVILTGHGREEEQMCGEIETDAGPGAANLAGRLGLRDLMSVLASYDVLVSSSTGPMHLAAALGIPCVSLFCPRPACCPTRWGPLGRGHRVLLPTSDRCGRCGPVRDPDCRLEEIPVEAAAEAVADVLRV